MSKAIKLLLTELVGQSRNILPLIFPALTSHWSVDTKKTEGNNSFNDSRSVNKSIVLECFLLWGFYGIINMGIFW